MQFISFDPQKRHNNSQVPCSVCLWYSFALTVQNPFGSAKPREEVIAKRTGKDEATIVAEAAKEYQVKVRLTPEQYAQKQACLQEITTLKETLATEPEDADEVQVRVTSHKQQQHPQQVWRRCVA
jgi:phage-related protein